MKSFATSNRFSTKRLRAIALTLVATVFVINACDPVIRVNAAKPIPAPLDEECVIQTLRAQKTVQSAGIGTTGLTYALLAIPETLKSPEAHPDVGVVEQENDKGELELELEMTWVGSKGTPEYRSYIQTTIEELRDQAIEKCGGK